MSKRSLVMLADNYDPLKYKPNGSYLSEKLDGIRALWLPFTRGLAFQNIPWANTIRDDRDHICSGLWSRRGKPIMAPDWFLDGLPLDMPLDGELFIGRSMFQQTTSVVRKLEPVDSEWQNVRYMVFDIPSYNQFFRSGQIREGGRNGEYECYFLSKWIDLFDGLKDSKFYPVRRFSENYSLLRKECDYGNVPWEPVEQVVLPHTHTAAESFIQEQLTRVTDNQGEGLMLRRGHSIWEPVRSADLAKVKKWDDSEATIVGYTYGRGKFADMVGAFKVRWNTAEPKHFDLSGFTEHERQLHSQFVGLGEDGEYTEESVSKHFPIGTVVTFRYYGLTKDGVPRFAQYWRKRVD